MHAVVQVHRPYINPNINISVSTAGMQSNKHLMSANPKGHQL